MGKKNIRYVRQLEQRFEIHVIKKNLQKGLKILSIQSMVIGNPPIFLKNFQIANELLSGVINSSTNDFQSKHYCLIKT
jgi:hypothetical protein